jgi:hypothetical protein
VCAQQISEALGTAMPASTDADIEAELSELFGEEELKVMDAMPAVPTTTLPVAQVVPAASVARPAAAVTQTAAAPRQRVAVPA